MGTFRGDDGAPEDWPDDEPASEVVILDDDGLAEPRPVAAALPGITLGPGQPPALMFSPDGKWLVVGIADGDSTRLLLYTAAGDGPFDPGLAVPGPVDSPQLTPAPN